MTNEVLHSFAHDLRSCLRVAMTRSQLLERATGTSATDREKEFLAQTISSISEADLLLNAFMRYADAHTQRETLALMPLDLVVRGALIEMRPKFERLGGVLRVDEPIPKDPVPGSAQFILKELLGNALKFRRDAPPQATIQCVVNGKISFCVEDNGIGIEATFCKELFSPFTRLHNRQTYPGHGLGLATCRALAEHSLGQIEYSAAVTGGSIFTCSFLRSEN